MKAVNIIVKIVTALAAAAGFIYILATYGDKMYAWANKVMDRLNAAFPKTEAEEVPAEETEEAPAEEAAEEAAPVEEVAEEEAAPAEEVAEEAAEEEAAPAEAEPFTAEESDFEG